MFIQGFSLVSSSVFSQLQLWLLQSTVLFHFLFHIHTLLFPSTFFRFAFRHLLELQTFFLSIPPDF